MIDLKLKTIMTENEKIAKKLEILHQFQKSLNDKSLERLKDLKKWKTEENDIDNLLQKLDL